MVPASTRTLNISVCFAHAEHAWKQSLCLPAGATLGDAIEASGFRAAFPDLDPFEHGVGVYGKVCEPDHALEEGDRVEIYRRLTFDPMESRRRRARHRANRR